MTRKLNNVIFNEEKARLQEHLSLVTELEAKTIKADKSLKALESSLSWKITAPFRFLTRRLFEPARGRAIPATQSDKAEKILEKLHSGELRKLDKRSFIYTKGQISKEEKERESAVVFTCRPKISILTPLFNTDPALLTDMLFSVTEQTYDNWELCLADASDGNHAYVGAIIDFFLNKDSRIKYVKLAENGGPSRNSNEAAKLASGEFYALLGQGDVLHPAALFKAAEAIDNNHAEFIYTDEAITNFENNDTCVFADYKPDFSPDFLLGCNYIRHFSVFSKQLIEKANGLFRSEFDGDQDYDLFLRLSENTGKIHHIPGLQYFQRVAGTSEKGNPLFSPHASAAGINALKDALKRSGLEGEVELALPDTCLYRIKYSLPTCAKVSIIIPTKDGVDFLENCIESILQRTTWKNYEIIVVDNGSEASETLSYLSELPSKGNIFVLRYELPFNYSTINNFAVEHATGDYLVFLNNDTDIISPDWIQEMLMFAQRDNVGIVGAKLLYANGAIQHAGMVANLIRVGHILRGENEDYANARLVVPVNYSAVTGACMMIRKKLFCEIGQFFEGFPVDFNDIDLCLRIRQAGYLVVFTPYAKLHHYESVSRGIPAELEDRLPQYSAAATCIERNKKYFSTPDPYFNISLQDNALNFKDGRRTTEELILEQKWKIRTLNSKLASLDKRKQQILNSVSWKISLPLRKMLDCFLAMKYNHELSARRVKSKKIALCCIVKLENDYLHEFVEYYHELGFDRIFIYDNNDIDGERPEDVIGDCPFVEIVNCRGMRNMQLPVYEEFYRKYGKQYAWIAFFDADEFLFLHKDKNVRQFLSRREFRPFDIVNIAWRNFNDSGLLGNENNGDRSIVSRFTNRELPCECKTHVKVFIRGGLCNVRFPNPHTPIAANSKRCDDLGRPCSPSPIQPREWTSAELRHYRKTIIEYIQHKLNRERSGISELHTDIRHFWEYSERSGIKQKIVDTYAKTGKIDCSIPIPQYSHGNRKIAIAVHEAHPGGATMIIKHVIRIMIEFGCDVKVILLRNGILRNDFLAMCDVFEPKDKEHPETELAQKAATLMQEGYSDIILNTTVCGVWAPIFKNAGMTVISLVHEMDYFLRTEHFMDKAGNLIKYSDKIVFPSHVVSDSWEKAGFPIPEKKLFIEPQSTYHTEIYSQVNFVQARKQIRKRLAIPQYSKIVLTAAILQERKGIKAFLETAKIIHDKHPEVYFVWIGTLNNKIIDNLGIRSKMNECEEFCIFPGHCPNPNPYFAAADIYFCPSTSDPYPTSVLEAVHYRLPVVLTEGLTGTAELFRGFPAGLVSDTLPEHYADEISKIFTKPFLIPVLKERLSSIADNTRCYNEYVSALLKIAEGQ